MRGSDAVKRARLACGISQAQAAEIAGFRCPQPYVRREENPEKFTIGEFFAIYGSVDDFAKAWLWEYLESKRTS